MIAARVNCAGGVQQSLDEQFRDLRAALDVFEAQCRERASRWEAMKPNNLVGSDILPGSGRDAQRRQLAGDARHRRLAAAFQIMQNFRRHGGMLTKIAVGIGVTPQAVHHWKVVRLQWTPDVERVTGIPRRRLRPDIFEAPVGAALDGGADGVEG